MVNKITKNDEGVSAVIGVILMVAITVILAAVIAAFVFSMSNNVGTTHTVAFTVKKNAAGNIVVTNNGGADVSKLDAVTITASTVAGTLTICTANIDLKTVGSSATLYPSTFTGTMPTYNDLAVTNPDPSFVKLPVATAGEQYHVIITGIFSDSTSQVLIAADV